MKLSYMITHRRHSYQFLCGNALQCIYKFYFITVDLVGLIEGLKGMGVAQCTSFVSIVLVHFTAHWSSLSYFLNNSESMCACIHTHTHMHKELLVWNKMRNMNKSYRFKEGRIFKILRSMRSSIQLELLTSKSFLQDPPVSHPPWLISQNECVEF